MSTGWLCGLHSDYTELKECILRKLNTLELRNRTRTSHINMYPFPPFYMHVSRKSSSGYAFECTFLTHLLETSSCLLVAQVNERVFVHNANQSLPRFQMLNLKHIPNEEWTYINCSIPLNEAFEAWSMTSTIDGILLSGLLDISAL